MKYRLDEKWIFIVVYTWNHRAAAICYYHQKKSTSHTLSHTVTKKEKSIFYSSKHMKSQVCCRPLLLYQKNPHLIRTPIRSRKKRNRFFIVVNTLVATKWLLMLGNFETLGSKFRHETAELLPSFSTIKKINFSSAPRKKGQALLDLPITFLEITF